MLIVFCVMAFAILMTIGNHNQRHAKGPYARSFQRLGPMNGKTMQQVIKAVGSPTSRSYTGSTTLLQWGEAGYHIAVKFGDRDVFSGVTSEYTGRRR
jgi:L-asparagine transporter-like permease